MHRIEVYINVVSFRWKKYKTGSKNEDKKVLNIASTVICR